MDKYQSKIITNKTVWEKFLLSEKPQTFLQSWNWGKVNELEGAKIFRIGFYKNNKLYGISLLVKEDAKRGPHMIIPAGPIFDWQNKKLVKFFLKTIRKIAFQEKCWFIRIRPELLDKPDSNSIFRKLGFIPAPMHLHAENTWVLDINKSDEEILKGMRKTTRYLVKKGERTGLSVEISSNTNLAKILFKLQKETARRHNFIGFPEKLFRNEIQIFSSDDNAKVFVCRDKDKILAIAIIIFYGDTAYYHFSASVSGHNDVPFSYLLQWEVIKEARKRGLKYYNFWGIAPNNNPKHRFAGVTLFKTGFGGRRVDWLHAHDLPISYKYWLTYIFESFRKMIRHL